MPANASPANRDRIEEVLGENLCVALAEQCRAWGIPRDRWHRVPTFARSWEVTAVVMLAERIAETQGIGAKSAIEAAAVYLDLAPDTILSRLKRACSDAYLRAA